MNNPYQRKKDPERVRQNILAQAANQLALKGATGMSLQAVADLAGVTKGGLLHHFPNKQILLQAVVQDVLQKLDQAVDAHIASDGQGHGCFTRAFIYFTLQRDGNSIGSLWTAISMVMLTDQAFNAQWMQWLNSRLARHAATDSSADLQLLRYAADGLWLNMLTGVQTSSEIERWREELIQRSYAGE